MRTFGISGRVNAWQTLPSSPIRITEFYHPAPRALGCTSGAYRILYVTVIANPHL